MKILSKLAFALVVLGSLLVTHAQTDDKNNVIVLNAGPDNVIQATVICCGYKMVSLGTVTNTTESPMRFRIDSTEAHDWLQLPKTPEQTTVAPGESKELPIRVLTEQVGVGQQLEAQLRVQLRGQDNSKTITIPTKIVIDTIAPASTEAQSDGKGNPIVLNAGPDGVIQATVICCGYKVVSLGTVTNTTESPMRFRIDSSEAHDWLQLPKGPKQTTVAPGESKELQIRVLTEQVAVGQQLEAQLQIQVGQVVGQGGTRGIETSTELIIYIVVH